MSVNATSHMSHDQNWFPIVEQYLLQVMGKIHNLIYFIFLLSTESNTDSLTSNNTYLMYLFDILKLLDKSIIQRY